ncbi:MAG: CCA tRNA nucleotidyltransferase, partial [Coprothermobacter proteolyticus]
MVFTVFPPSINHLVTFTAETAYQIVRSLPDHTNFTIYNNNMDFLVGGCLRDIILGKPPKDYDIISDAHVPFEPKVVLGKDVLTYRYIIGGKIVDVSSHLNLQKRDFPMNAMALDFQGNFYDPRGGLEDLFNRQLSVEKER